MRKILSFLLILCLLAVPAFAQEPEASGTCGEAISWTYADGQLTIAGSGYMDDFEGNAPWAAYKDAIKRVVLSGSIEYIGARSFTDYDALETVNFGSSLYEIGAEAFKSCDGLTVIYLPTSFKVFGESSFSSCSNLTSIHCSGRPATFKLNSMWNTYGTIYYPAEKPWGADYIQQMETAFKGRIEFLASDGTDQYRPEEATQPVTEAPTQAPTEAPTEAPTVAPTVAPTQAPEQILPEEIPVTAPQEKPETEAATEPVAVPAQKIESKSWIGLVIIGTVAAFVLLGMIIVGISNRRGKYSKRRKKR